MTTLTNDEKMNFGLRLVKFRSKAGFEDTASFARAVRENYPYITYRRILALEKAIRPKVDQDEITALCDTLSKSNDCITRGMCDNFEHELASQLKTLTEPQKSIIHPTVDTLIKSVKQRKVR